MGRTRIRNRGQRSGSQPTSPLAHIPWQPITNHMPPLEYLRPDEVAKLHEASLRILEKTGIAFMDAEALDIWEKAGATVDHKSEVVKIDRHQLLDLVAKAPSRFTWRARNPAKSMEIGGNRTTFAPQGGVVFVNDLDRGRRPGMMSDYINFLKIQQQCNSLHFVGDQIIVPHDIAVSFRHLHRSQSAILHSDKCFMEAPHGRIIAADAVEMAKIVFQEDITQSDQPALGGVINASSPLRYDERMIGGMLTYARARQVLIMTPFVLAGAMSPITMAAAIAQQNAEALAGIAFVQLVSPGSPVMYGGFATNLDMKTGGPAFGTPEGAWAMMVGAQMARFYNLPYRGSGSLNTSQTPDAQSAYETMWSIWPAVMAHTNFIMHAVGWLEGGLTVSYEKIIMDMENLAMLEHFFQPVPINDETLALDMIDMVGPGGHHLGTPHTQARYATEFYQSFLMDRQGFQTWQERGSEDTAVRANKIWKELLKTYEPPELETAVSDELAAFVERRTRELEGVELYT